MTSLVQIHCMIIAQASTRFNFPCMWSNDELKEEIITLNVGDLVDYMRKQDMMPDSLPLSGCQPIMPLAHGVR